MKRLTVSSSMLLLATILIGALPANAQHNIADLSPKWWNAVETQHTLSLDSPINRIRSMTLKQISYLATYYPDQIDFDTTVPRLLEVYENDRSRQCRSLAVDALEAIGDEYAMTRLAELAKQESSSEVRARTLEAVAAFEQGRIADLGL